jgi:hypothetical protein
MRYENMRKREHEKYEKKKKNEWEKRKKIDVLKINGEGSSK